MIETSLILFLTIHSADVVSVPNITLMKILVADFFATSIHVHHDQFVLHGRMVIG